LRGPDLLRESLPVGAGKLLRIAYYEGDLILIGFLSTAEQAGYYFAAQRVSLSVAAIVLLQQQAVFPALSRLIQADVGQGARFQERVTGYALLWVVPAAAGAILLSVPFMALLFGAEYRESGSILLLLLLTMPVMVLQLGFHNQMLARARTKAYLWTIAGGTVAHVLLGILWTREWGGAGAAAASLAGELIICGAAAWYVTALNGTTVLGRRSLFVIAAGAAMTGAMLLTRQGGLIVATATGLLVYCVIVLALRVVTLREVRAALALLGKHPRETGRQNSG
jgi:O-antigen/teichoic acid export membrane protein